MSDEQSKILWKLIETQQSLTSSLATLTTTVIDMNQSIDQLNNHFSNGFRSDLKQHFSTELQITNDKLDTVLSPGFFIKLGIVGVGVVGSMASLIAIAITYFMS